MASAPPPKRRTWWPTLRVIGNAFVVVALVVSVLTLVSYLLVPEKLAEAPFFQRLSFIFAPAWGGMLRESRHSLKRAWQERKELLSEPTSKMILNRLNDVGTRYNGIIQLLVLATALAAIVIAATE